MRFIGLPGRTSHPDGLELVDHPRTGFVHLCPQELVRRIRHPHAFGERRIEHGAQEPIGNVRARPGIVMEEADPDLRQVSGVRRRQHTDVRVLSDAIEDGFHRHPVPKPLEKAEFGHQPFEVRPAQDHAPHVHRANDGRDADRRNHTRRDALRRDRHGRS